MPEAVGVDWLERRGGKKRLRICSLHPYKCAYGGVDFLGESDIRPVPPASLADLRKSLRAPARLTFRPWFERAWTFQEATLPPAVSFICGRNSMPIKYLGSCAHAIVNHADTFISSEASLVLATRKLEDTFSEDSGRLPLDNLEPILTFR